MSMELEALDHVGLTVAEVARSVRAARAGRGQDGHLVESTTYEVPRG